MTARRPDRRARAARGVLASSFATGVALASHLLAGGGAPAPAVVLLALVLCWPLGVVLIGRRPGWAGQAAVVGVAEAALHGLLAVGVAGGPAVAVHAHLEMPGAPAGPAMAGHAGSAMLPSHGVAALLTLLAWREGESALGVLLRAAGTTLVRILRLPVVTSARMIARPRRRRTRVLLHVRLGMRVDPRRGPPMALPH